MSETAVIETTTTSAPAEPAATTPVTFSDQRADGTPVGTAAIATQVNEASAQTPPQAPAPQDWKAALAEDLRKEKSLETFKDVNGLAKSFVELRKTLGSAIKPPSENAAKEEWDTFYEKLGWEKDLAKVTAAVKGPILPQGIELKEEEVHNFAKAGHELRLSPKQIQGVLDYYGNFVKNVVPDYKGDSEQAVKVLKDDWGLAIDRNMGVARRALLNDFPKETVEKIEKAGLANDIGFIKSMFERGKGLIEEGIIPEEIGQGIDNTSAQAKINEIEGDPKSPLYDKSHPRHAEFVEKRNNLYRVLYPKE